MVSKLIKIFNGEITALHEAAYLLASFTFLSQILGLIRDRLLADTFGAGAALDVYYSAFRIPDLIFVSVASLVSVSVLVPFVVDRFSKGEIAVRQFLDTIFSFFSIFVIAASVVAFFLAPVILRMIFPALTTSDLGEVFIAMTRWMLFSPILLGFSNFFASISQARHRFFAYALSPAFYNLGIIAGIVFFYPAFGLIGLAYGVVLGAALHLLCQLSAAPKPLPRFKLFFNFKLIKEVIFLSLSRTLALSVGQISTLFLIAIASLFTAGSVTVFNFAWNLQSVPLALIGVSYTVALFPTISRLFSNGERQKFLEEITVAARHIIFWSVPIIVLFIVLRAQIVRTILGSGNFDWTDTRLTAATLAVFSVSILAQSLILLFVRGYYAGGNTRKPLIINTIAAFLVIISAFVFLIFFHVWPFFRLFIESLLRVVDVPGTEVLMLPLGFSTAMLLNAGIFWFYFARRFPKFNHLVSRTFFEIFSASIIMGFITYKCLDFFDDVFNINTFVGIFTQGLLSGLIGIFCLIMILLLLKSKELKEVWSALHHKIWKARVIVPEQESL